jgi:2-oxo-3-hexenedioate decarboxylase
MDVDARATRRLDARDSGTSLERDPDLDLAEAYVVASELERRLTARGHRRVGRKIGFTNRATWTSLGLDRPIWAPIYDTTLTRDTTVDLRGLPEPRLEPEIVLGLGADARTPDELVVAWAALGVEIVASHHPGWRLTPGEAVADFGMHAQLVVGPALDPAAVRDLVVTLTAPDGSTMTGRSTDVLGGPVEALVALLDLPGASPVRAGEVVTTGSLVTPPWISPGQRWSVAVDGGPELVVGTS